MLPTPHNSLQSNAKPLNSHLAMIPQKSPKLTLITSRGSTGVAQEKPEGRDSQFHFTKKSLDSLPIPPHGRRAYYYDDEIRGLAVAVFPSGKKTFTLYRKLMGRPERIKIGRYPDITITQARIKAQELNERISIGVNPAEKQRAIRNEMTLEELFNEYLEHHAKPHNKTWRQEVSKFNRHLDRWRRRSISTIRKIDVVTLHVRVGKTAKYAANRVVELLSAMYGWAIDEAGWAGENPGAKVKPFREHKRERFLQAEELPRFFASVAEEPNETARDYVLISLLTGARKANVLAMRWEEISFERALWRIPETKSGEPQDVHLSAEAARILSDRKATSTSPWVFPGVGRSGHLADGKTPWHRILKRAGLTNLRLHDLRRTLGSWEAGTGASLSIIGKSLGHKNTQATAIYARLNIDPVRAAVDKATEAMLLAGGVNIGKK